MEKSRQVWKNASILHSAALCGSYLRFPSQAGPSPDSNHRESRLSGHKLQHGRQRGPVRWRRSLLLKDQSLEGQTAHRSHPGKVLPAAAPVYDSRMVISPSWCVIPGRADDPAPGAFTPIPSSKLKLSVADSSILTGKRLICRAATDGSRK